MFRVLPNPKEKAENVFVFFIDRIGGKSSKGCIPAQPLLDPIIMESVANRLKVSYHCLHIKKGVSICSFADGIIEERLTSNLRLVLYP
jgi:hypothetical protein